MGTRKHKVNAHAVRLSYFLCDPLLSVEEAERMARTEAEPATTNGTGSDGNGEPVAVSPSGTRRAGRPTTPPPTSSTGR